MSTKYVIAQNGSLRDARTGTLVFEFDRIDNAVEISLKMFKGMAALAHVDPGMADLLLKAKEYYTLKGSPDSDETSGGWGQTKRQAENNTRPR